MKIYLSGFKWLESGVTKLLLAQPFLFFFFSILQHLQSRILVYTTGLRKFQSRYPTFFFLPDWKWKWKWKSFSCVWLFATPGTIQSTEFSRPEYWSGYPFPSLGDLPNPGVELGSPCRWILCQLSHKGNPRILEWAAYPFSSGSSQPRNPTWVESNLGIPALQVDSLSTELSGQPIRKVLPDYCTVLNEKPEDVTYLTCSRTILLKLTFPSRLLFGCLRVVPDFLRQFYTFHGNCIYIDSSCIFH